MLNQFITRVIIICYLFGITIYIIITKELERKKSWKAKAKEEKDIYVC